MNLSVAEIILNTLFLTGVLSLTFIYYLLRYREMVYQRIKQSVGWGDILLLPFLLVSCSFGNFVVFFLLSLLGSLVWFLSTGGLLKPKTIPLAGIQSGIMVIALFMQLLKVLNLNVDVIKLL